MRISHSPKKRNPIIKINPLIKVRLTKVSLMRLMRNYEEVNATVIHLAYYSDA